MIQVDISKAKEIAHEKRRNKRADLFKQLDIEATVPVLAEQAEVQRQAIRDEFAVIQTEIDSAATVEELTIIVTQL